MTIQNAIKKLEKNGFKVKQVDNGAKFNRNYVATNPNHRRFIEVLTQGDDVSIIDLRTPGHEDELMTDYHAGTFCDNIAQAIRYATTW